MKCFMSLERKCYINIYSLCEAYALQLGLHTDQVYARHENLSPGSLTMSLISESPISTHGHLFSMVVGVFPW